MKFCYIDESGTGSEPYAIMVGVVVDHIRMHKTKREWEEHLQSISVLANRSIEELHMNKFYPGNTPYNNINGLKRSEIITQTLEWFCERKHMLCISMIDKEKYKRDKEMQERTCNSYWCLMAMHIIAQLQRKHKSENNNKGKTILIFDEKVRDKDKLRNILKQDTEWLDDYYSDSKVTQTTRLDQIVDYPYYCDSRDVGLIQMVDVIAYIMRTYIEIAASKRNVKYTGEDDKLRKWVDMVRPTFLPKNHMLPSRNSACADRIKELSPELFVKYIRS